MPKPLSIIYRKIFENTFPVTTVDIEYFLGKRDGHSSERAANVIMKYCQASPKNKISIAKKCNTADTMTPIQHSACNAISWLHTHSSNGGANVSHKNTVPYPEVTGYLIPTLLKWNQPQLAMCYARWLLTVQNADGSFSGPGMTTPFAFDTGQIIRGLAAIVPSLPEAEVALEKACDWIMRTATPEGRLALPENMNGGVCRTAVDSLMKPSTSMCCRGWSRQEMFSTSPSMPTLPGAHWTTILHTAI